MEPEFFLPYIDELKRLDRNTPECKLKTTSKTALDRFYSSDLFDRNVLSVLHEFFKPRYIVEDYMCQFWLITKTVDVKCEGMHVQIRMSPDVCPTSLYMRLNPIIIILIHYSRTSVKNILSHKKYRSLSAVQRHAIKKAVEAILADPNIFP